MPRLIDADALAFDVLGLTIVSPEVMNYANAVTVAIAKAPTIDAEPVRHGRWIRDDLGRTCCSVCEKLVPYVEEYDTDEDCGGTYEVEIDETPYCPNCGAKMDLEG